jgi:hypothetical protein
MPELVAEFLRRALLSLSNLAAIHEDVVVVFDAIDLDRSECKIFKEHFDRMLRLRDTRVSSTEPPSVRSFQTG